MEMINFREQTSLIGELTQGRELANQLKNQLDPVRSRETCEALLEKIVSTYDKALSVLQWRSLKRESPFAGNGFLLESSHSPVDNNNNSPTSDCSDRVCMDHQECQNKDVFKKRKTLPRWSEQVRVCSGTGLEGPLDDGHSWRKYGQKDILGAKFPRAYYRCTHRKTQGCLATKQVQRSEEDSTVFEVTYKGRHSCCNRVSNSISNTATIEKEIPEKNKPMLQDMPRQAQETPLLNFGEGLKVETEDLNTREEIFPCFSFSPFTPIESENIESQFFKETDLMGCYSSEFLSPTSSESNYFSSPCKNNSFIIGSFTEKSESDHTDAIATPTSVINSPFGDLEISIDEVDFDPDLPLDTFAFA